MSGDSLSIEEKSAAAVDRGGVNGLRFNFFSGVSN
jgi:hypothetical protein